MDACSAAARDEITAFAVPNPGSSSQSQSEFGVWRRGELPRQARRSAYFRSIHCFLDQPFQPSTIADYSSRIADAVRGITMCIFFCISLWKI
jgi:hypothetical protein